jgi:parvulin-like peptidyl-prolyl isomerase
LAAGAAVVMVTTSLSGCSSTLGYAAVVNGSVISQSTINQDLASISANKQYVAAIVQQGVGPVAGSTAGTYNKAFVAILLDQQVRYEIIRQDLEAHKALPSSAQVATAKGEVSQAFPSGIYAAFPASYQAVLANQQAESDSFVASATSDLTDSGVTQYYLAHQSDYATEACVRHILLADKGPNDTIDYPASLADAKKVQGLLAAGGDFAALAKQYSKDNQGTDGGSAAQGGMLTGSAPDGCLTTQDLQQLITQFAQSVISLPLNVVSQPVKTQFGYHLIEVTKRSVEPLDTAVTSDIHQRVAGDRLTTLVTSARVKVNPEFGSFDAKVDPTNGQVPGVQPPIVPNLTPTTSTTVPTAGG